jgi:hypothetical protein
MSLKVVSEVRALIETAKPKTPAVQLNQQFNNGLTGGNGYGPGMSFERMLRAKREQAGLANDQEIETIDGVTQEDELADEFAEFGGDEGEDGEEDGDEG